MDKKTIIAMCIVYLSIIGIGYCVYTQQQQLKAYVSILTSEIEQLNASVDKCVYLRNHMENISAAQQFEMIDYDDEETEDEEEENYEMPLEPIAENEEIKQKCFDDKKCPVKRSKKKSEK